MFSQKGKQMAFNEARWSPPAGEIITASAMNTAYPTISLPVVKQRCAYCGGNTVDDTRGNCGACGGPRIEEKKRTRPQGNSTHRADSGPIFQGPYTVGEAGPELIIAAHDQTLVASLNDLSRSMAELGKVMADSTMTLGI